MFIYLNYYLNILLKIEFSKMLYINYEIINEKRKQDKFEIKKHNGVEIEYRSGKYLLDLVFGEDKEVVIVEFQKFITSLFTIKTI
jgi:hypothetical protein